MNQSSLRQKLKLKKIPEKSKEIKKVSVQVKNFKFSKLKSNLVYIRCFRVELKGEEEYYITALESALEFILNLKLSDLKLDQNEEKVFKSLSEGGLN